MHEVRGMAPAPAPAPAAVVPQYCRKERATSPTSVPEEVPTRLGRRPMSACSSIASSSRVSLTSFASLYDLGEPRLPGARVRGAAAAKGAPRKGRSRASIMLLPPPPPELRAGLTRASLSLSGLEPPSRKVKKVPLWARDKEVGT